MQKKQNSPSCVRREASHWDRKGRSKRIEAAKIYFWAAEQWPKAKGDLNSDHAQLLAPIACS